MQEFTRRGCLTGVVAIAGLSGCQDVIDGGSRTDDDSDDESDDTPEDESTGPGRVVETYYRALNQGEFAAANERLHSETLEPTATRDQYGQLVENDFEVASTELLERTETRALVRVNVTYSTGSSSDTISDSVTVELRPENDAWRIYAVGPRIQSRETPTEEPTPDREEPTPESETPVAGDPKTVVREFYAALDAGNRAAANARLHSDAQGSEVTERTAQSMEEASLTVDSVTLVDRSGDTATVLVEITLSPADSDRERTSRLEIVLRPENGRWKIYAVSTPS